MLSSASSPTDRGDFDFDADVGPDQRRDDPQHEHRLVRDHLGTDRRVGRQVVGVGQSLPDADDIGQCGTGPAECLLHVAPRLRDLLGEVVGQSPSGRNPGVPDVWITSTPAGIRTASA